MFLDTQFVIFFVPRRSVWILHSCCLPWGWAEDVGQGHGSCCPEHPRAGTVARAQAPRAGFGEVRRKSATGPSAEISAAPRVVQILCVEPWGMAPGGRNALAARCSCSRAMQGAIAPSQLGGEREKTLLPSRRDKTVSAGGLLPGRARGQSPAGVGGDAGP